MLSTFVKPKLNPRAVLSSEAYDDSLSYHFSWPTKAALACLVECSVRIAHLAVRNRASAGNVWHTQRDLAVLSLSSGKLIGKSYCLPPSIPTPPERVWRGRAQPSMRKEGELHGLSYPKRIGQRSVFSVSRAIAAATGLTPPWTYLIFYCNRLCGKDAPGGLAAGDGPPAVRIVWAPRRPRGDV